MDPVSAAHIAGTALSVAKSAWDVGTQLYMFVQNAKNLDNNLQSLAGEVRALGQACNVVGTRLESIVKERDDETERDTGLQEQNKQLWFCLEGQISDCQSTVLQLQEAVKCANRDFNKDVTFINQAIRQIKLNMKTKDISDARARIQSQFSCLQLLLQVVTTYVGLSALMSVKALTFNGIPVRSPTSPPKEQTKDSGPKSTNSPRRWQMFSKYKIKLTPVA